MKKDTPVLTLGIEAIHDFQACSLFYSFRYLEHEHELVQRRELLAQKFENTLQRVAAFFFYKRQAGITPSYNALINRWEKLWFPKSMDAYDLAVEQHESAHGNLASYSNAATKALLQFHENFAHDKAEPILIDEPFLITAGNGLRLSGRIDLILKSKKSHRVIMWSAQLKHPSMGSLMLDFALQKLAFDYRNDYRVDTEYYLYDLASANTGFTKATPSKADVNALLYWAKEAAETEHFIPRRGLTTYCRGCPFDSACLAFKGWPEHERIS